MKKILTYICVVIAIIYTAVWFFVAHKIEKEVYNAFAQLKTDKKLKKYSATVSVSGFPFSFNVKFISPSFAYNAGDDNTDLNILFDGTINAKVGLFSKYFTVTTLGNLHLRGNVGDYKFNVISEGDRLSTYQLQFSGVPISPLFIKKAMAESASSKPNYLTLIEGFSMDTRAFTARDRVSEKPLVEATRIVLNLEGDISSDNMSFSGKEFVDRVKFFPESKRLWQNLKTLPVVHSLLQSVGGDIKNYFDIFALYELGMMSYTVNFDYEGNKSKHQIKLSELRIRDDLYTVDAKGTISLSNKSVEADFVSSILCSDKWYPLMKEYVNTLSNKGQFIDRNFSDKSIVGLILTPVTDFMNALLKDGGYGKYVPQLNLVGPIKTEANLLYKPINDQTFDLKVKKFNMSTRMYFADLKGDLKHESEKDVYNVKAVLGNYVSVVDQTIGYVNRVSTASSYKFNIFGSSAISASISDKIKRFLRNVSDNPSSQSKDLKLTVVNSGKSVYPAVGPYNSEEFHQAWNSFVASIIIDKVTGKINRALQKGVGDTIKDGLKGNVVGSFNNLAQGVLELLR